MAPGIDLSPLILHGTVPDALEQPKKQRPQRKPSPRPDHFLAFRLAHNVGVATTIATVQSSIVNHSPHLQPALVDPASVHITLGVLCLPDEASLRAASSCLAIAIATATSELGGPPPPVVFEGISHFDNRVLFLDVRQDENSRQFLKFASAVRDYFQAEGLLLQTNKAFVPHVTIAKTSKIPQPWRPADSRWRSTDKQRLLIPVESYQDHVEVHVGSVEFGQLELCRMSDRKQGEYYPVIASVKCSSSSCNGP